MGSQMTLASVVAGCVTFLGAVSVSRAAEVAWNVDAGGSWADDANWMPAAAPGASDTAVFSYPLTDGRTVAVDAGRAVGGLSFGNTNGFAYTLSGGSLLLASGGVVQTLADNGEHVDVISSPVVIQGDGGTATFSANALLPGSDLVISGNVSCVATSGKTNTLTLTGTSTNAGMNLISGVISDGGGGGSLAITKSGPTNVWILGGPNTFSGAVNIQQGTLVAAHDSALGAASSLAVPGKCRLGLKGGVTIAGKALVVDGGASTATSDNGILLNVDGTNTWAGNITMFGHTPRFNSDAGKLIVSGNVNMGSALTNNFTLGGYGDGEISGVISGSEVVFRSSSDTGTWYLTGTNTHTSAMTVGNGTVAINSDRSLGAVRSAFSASAVTVGGSTRRGTLRAIADVTLSDKYGITLHNLGGFINVDSGRTFRLNGIIADRTSGGLSGPLTKIGAGTMVLGAANTFSNKLEVAEGTVILAVTNALFGKSGFKPRLKVDAALDLGGYPVATPELSGAGGTISNGTLSVTLATLLGGDGAVAALAVPATTLSGTLTADVETDGTCDRLNVSGDLALSGVSLSIVNGGNLRSSNVYTLAQCAGGTVSGTFSSDNLPENWHVEYSADRVQISYFAGMIMTVK